MGANNGPVNAVAALPIQERVTILNAYRSGEETTTLAAMCGIPEPEIRDWLRGLRLLRMGDGLGPSAHRQAVEQRMERAERVVRPLTPLAPSVFDSALVNVRAALVREYRAMGLAVPDGVIPFEDGR
jgi:hypothetical protein